MWPFSGKQKSPRVPAIRVGPISARWNLEFGWWEFRDGDFAYLLADNPEFDVALVDQLGKVKRWLSELDQAINAEIKLHLDGRCEWSGNKEVVSIDVSALMSKQEIDVAYVDGDRWGDLGINVVIVAGKVANSYAGD